METARIVSVQGEGLLSSPLGEDLGISPACDNEAAQWVPQKSRNQASPALSAESKKEGDVQRHMPKGLSKILKIPRPKTTVETQKSRSKHSSGKRLSKTLRFSTGTKISEEREGKSSTIRRSESQNLRRFQEGERRPQKRVGHRMRRSSSTGETGAHGTSIKRASLCRSSSEQEYSTELLKVMRVSPRSNSRRWRADAFPEIDQGEEGELDSIFRFIEECTRAVVDALKGMPTILSELPRRTREVFERLFLSLQEPNVPLLEGPNNSSEA